MQQAVASNALNELYNICKTIKKIPHYDLMFFIPEHITTYNREKNIGLLTYDNKYDSLLKFINSGKLIIKERELFFYKKHLCMCLEELHKYNIFYYFHIDDLYIHSESKMPLMYNFEKSCFVDFNNSEKRENIMKMFAKPIKNKYIPFSLFFFHFIAFSLINNREDRMKEISIYELYDNNVSIFYGWNQDELKEVEHIVLEGKNYEGIFDYYLGNSALWFHWDYVILERSFMKLT